MELRYGKWEISAETRGFFGLTCLTGGIHYADGSEDGTSLR